MRARSLLLLVLMSGCGDGEETCTTDEGCRAANGGLGRCVVERCAFVDQSCPSGLRFDDQAGLMTHQCVAPELLDGGGLPADAAMDGGVDAAVDASTADQG